MSFQRNAGLFAIAREGCLSGLQRGKRIIIETLRKEGRSLSCIAERIGCNKSTVSKEIKRNKSKRG